MPYDHPFVASPMPLRASVPGAPVWVDSVVDCRNGPFYSVDVMLSTYARKNPGKVELQVLTSEGVVLTKAEAEASMLVDNAFQTFSLPRTVCRDRSESVRLRLQYHARDRNSHVAYWLPAKAPGFVYRRLGQAFAGGGSPPPTVPYAFQPVAVSGDVQIKTRCPGSPMSAIGIRLSTYARVNPGRLVLTLRSAEGGSVLGTSVLDSAKIVDNATARFSFSPPVCNSSEQDVIAELSHVGGLPGHTLAYWRNPNNKVIDHTIITVEDLGFAQVYADEQAGAQIWENQRAQPRVYLAPEFEQRASWGEAMKAFAAQDNLRRAAVGERGEPACRTNPSYPPREPAAKVQRIVVGPNTVEAELDAHTAGTLVVTDNYLPGWRATVNGKDEPTLRVNGTFRGVCIPAPGHYNISWRYRPPLWIFSLWLAALGGVILVGAFTWSYMRRR
jgi:hypothetical protein